MRFQKEHRIQIPAGRLLELMFDPDFDKRLNMEGMRNQAWELLERPVQNVRRQVKLPLIELDLRDLSPEEHAARVAAFNEEERRRGYELARAPLLRIALLRLADDA